MRQLRREEFPPLLKEIPHVPKTLYLRGVLPAPERKLLCIVGSRRVSPYGQRALRALVSGLARAPLAVVSGLAWGTDALAHQAALDAGLPTVAVVPSGLGERVLYPRMNRPLAAHILAQGGALLSENPPDFKPQLYSFPARNRIMAGMSHATLIIEAGEKSGTLITARLALDYNRELLGVPHPLYTQGGEGVNGLLREGATLVRHSDDILQVLKLRPGEQAPPAALPADLTPAEKAVLAALTEPCVRDELLERAGLSAQHAGIALSSLLIRGLITERLGKIERL